MPAMVPKTAAFVVADAPPRPPYANNTTQIAPSTAMAIAQSRPGAFSFPPEGSAK